MMVSTAGAHVRIAQVAVSGVDLDRRVVQTLDIVLLLPFHAPILEPDLDLPLGQAQRVGDLDATPPCQVLVEVELFLQLQGLVARVGLSGALVLEATEFLKFKKF